MATRIEIELTSRRDDETFTWRAAGAREPRGVVDVSLFPDDSDVGSRFKVEAEVELDGITITNVLPAKGETKAKGFETLDLISGDDEPLVTQQLAEKGRGGRDRGDKKGKGKGKPKGKGKGNRRSERKGGDTAPRTPAKPKLPPKPKPPRLKAGRAHRDAVVAGLPEEQKPVAEEVLKGGLQAVRAAVASQNEQAKAEGRPEIDERRMVALAEELLVKVRAAEWRDRAEAALEQAETVDVRDLRSVVTAADGAAKDEESRALAAKLRDALAERLDADHQAWIAEIIELLDDDRTVRALHLSSRPPKAGAPLPAPVAMRLVEAANASMTAETSPDRWSYILDALAHSPVRRQVVPASLPANVPDELRKAIARHGNRLPEIAEIFGVEPDKPAPKRKRKKARKPGRTAGDAPAGAAPDAGAPTGTDAPTGAAPDAGEAPAADATSTGDGPAADDASTGDGPAADTSPAEAAPDGDETPAGDDTPGDAAQDGSAPASEPTDAGVDATS